MVTFAFDDNRDVCRDWLVPYDVDDGGDDVVRGVYMGRDCTISTDSGDRDPFDMASMDC